MKIKYIPLLIISSIICSCSVASVGVSEPPATNDSTASPQPSAGAINNSGNTNSSQLTESGSISGMIKLISNNTISDATVEIYKNDKLFFSTKANSDGNYNFSNIPVGQGYSIKVKSNGNNDFWYYDVNVNKNTNVTLDQMYLSAISSAKNTVKGLVKDSENLANLQGALIKAFNNAGLLISTGLVGSNGSYNLDIPVGIGHYFEISKANYQKFNYRNINVNSGSSISLEDLALASDTSDFATASGILNFPNSLIPLANIPIKVYRNMDSGRYFIQEIISGLNGLYSFRVPSGSNYSFDVLYDGKIYTANKFSVNSGNNNLGNIELTTAANNINTPVILPSSSPSPLVSPSVSASPAKPAFSGSGKIFFNEDRQVYLMNSDGSSPTQITTNGFFNGYPSLSPDGTKILVLSNMAGVIDSGIGTSILQMYTMNVDGTKPTRITKDDQRYLDPVWSPDGSKIAFASSVKDKDTYQGYHYELFTANADGSNKTKITTGEQRSGYVTDSINPSWSPDSSKLSFTSNKTRYYSIYTINADGSNQNKISLKETTNYEEQSWSPDGTKIVFSRISGETVKNNEIFSINIDGSNETQLTDDKSEDKYPSWSPDSSKIVFTSNREKILNTENKGFQVYVMNSDGTNQTRITATDKEHINPRWAK